MWTDVVDLNDFYRGSLGKTARHMIRLEIRRLWPDVRGQTVAGVGYATPYLRQFVDEAERTLAVMPAYQGVTHWPRDGANKVALSDETALPFPDLSIDRLLLVHAVENTEHLRALMRECWRVLSGQGRLLAVMPARRGFWSNSERTPFGHGKPFTRQQFLRVLRDSQFDPTQTGRALFVPPMRSRMMLHSAPAWERIGRRWFAGFGGVLLVEAEKQIYAATPLRKPEFARPRLLPPLPVPQPRPAAGRGHQAPAFAAGRKAP